MQVRRSFRPRSGWCPNQETDHTGPVVVYDRAPHALDRLLRAVPPALLALSITERIVVGDLPHGGLLAVTLPLAGLALAHRVPAIFMTPFVVAPAQCKLLLDPN